MNSTTVSGWPYGSINKHPIVVIYKQTPVHETKDHR